jgi:hypothetical protein
MTQAIADFGQRTSVGRSRFLGRVGTEALAAVARIRAQAEVLSSIAWTRIPDGDPLRTWTLTRLLQATILTCATIAVVRRTHAFAQAQRGWQRGLVALSRAWAKAEGFEVEASAGIALVVLAFVIVVHGLLTG